jgi:hypothetical protein
MRLALAGVARSTSCAACGRTGEQELHKPSNTVSKAEDLYELAGRYHRGVLVLAQGQQICVAADQVVSGTLRSTSHKRVVLGIAAHPRQAEIAAYHLCLITIAFPLVMLLALYLWDFPSIGWVSFTLMVGFAIAFNYFYFKG